jgi:sigma-B regulation protein RsbU (phosphoserine phosphatase)
MPETEHLVEYRFPARADHLCEARQRVRDTAGRYGFSPEDVGALVLAVDEACANIIRHAYGHDKPGDIVLEILESDDKIIFRLIDFASPVDPRAIRARDLEDIRPGGLGVHFMREVMDEVEYMTPPRGVGNVLEMRKSLARD